LYLYQDENGFLFNSDAHFLYNFISKFNPKGELLDIGSGCGIVGLLCARDFPVNLTLIDKQKHNTFISKINAKVNKLDANVIEGDFIETNFDKKFDFIVSNPPYYHQGITSSQSEHIAIAKENNYLPIESMIKKVNTIIKPRGDLIFCYDAKQLPRLLYLLENKKFIVENIQFVHGTTEKPAHLVMIHAKKGSKSLCKTEPPLINFINRQQSKEVKSIYQKTRTYSIKCKII